MIGQPDNFLIFPFVTDFRPAEHNFQVGPRQFELADNFRCRRHIPDINPETDDLRAAIRRITDHPVVPIDFLVTQAALAVKEVAWACGYANPSYFIHSFRAQYGQTPKGYRQRNEKPV